VGWVSALGFVVILVSVLADLFGLGSDNGEFGRVQIVGVVAGGALFAADALGVARLRSAVDAIARLRQRIGRTPVKHRITGWLLIGFVGVVWAGWLGRWQLATVLAGVCTLAAVWSWANAREARRRTKFAAGCAIGLLTVLGAFVAPYGPVECSSGDWPAFMLGEIHNEHGAQQQGWILWCHESHWTMHVAGEFAGETASRQTRGKSAEVFPWFSPDLTPQEAWQQLTGTPELREVAPRHDLAEVAFTMGADDGRYRMEFTAEGIPVLVRVPGADGFRFRADEVSFADRPLRSDDDIMNWPSCSHFDGSSDDGPPCWYDSGNARPLEEGSCHNSLRDLTPVPGKTYFQTLGGCL
jgi:hypothetical protein